MVSAGHYAAAAAANRILEMGGNATDAGVAAGLCINVVQPDLTNLGGVAPICVYSQATGEVSTLSGLGQWPKDVDPQYFVDKCDGRIPPGVRRCVVPAAAGAWLTALENFGTMTFAQVAESAIELAEGGFPVHSVMYDTIADHAALRNMRMWPSTAEIYLTDSGDPPPVGSLLRQEDLGRLLRKLVEAEKGAPTREGGIRAAYERFYRGDIAKEIASFSERMGGWLSASDLADFRIDIEPAETVSYRGYEVYSCGAWCQGPVVLQTLNILEGYDFGDIEQGSARYFHLIVESLKSSFADRDKFYGDPAFVNVPIEGLLSKAYAAAWRERISLDEAFPGMPDAGDPWAYTEARDGSGQGYEAPRESQGEQEPDTSYVCVVDGEGNAFSATPSDGIFGTPVVSGLGIIMSGRGMQSWLDPTHPSTIRPGKRPRLTPNPGLVLKGNDFVMPYGTPGLDVQPQAMVQFLLGVIDYDLDVQEAIEKPRAATYSFPGSSDPHPYSPGLLKVEKRVPDKVRRALQELGHNVEQWPEWTGLAGSLSAAKLDRSLGRVDGGADPRRVAYAIGW